MASTVLTLGAGTHTIRLAASGGTVTVSEVGAFSITTSSTTDTGSSSDSNSCEVKSPAAVSVSDSSGSTDSVSCTVTIPTSIATPFLLAASIVAMALWDSANADTGSAADSVTIAQTLRHTDSGSQADANSIAISVPISDSSSSSDLVSAVVGIYTGDNDTSTSSDSVEVTLSTNVTVSDVSSSSDVVGLEFISPEAVEVVDSSSSTDSNVIVYAIGQVDASTSTDSVIAVVGTLVSVSDGGSSSELVSCSVSSAPPTNVVPHAAVADAIVVGVLAEENRPGMRADPITVGMLYGSVLMKIGKCYQGCDFPVFFPKVKDAKGDEVDLSGATLRCYALVGGTPVAAASTSVDATKGTAQATFSATQTNALTPGTTYSFDGVVTLASGLEYPIGSGRFTVYDPITPTP